MKNEKISIIIPVFNGEKYIEKTLKSIELQNYLNLEIIVINDESTDGTLEILKKYEGKIKIINQKNGGASKARNTGFKEVTGKYIIFLDADDWLEEGAIDDAYKILKQTQSEIVLFDKINYLEETKYFEEKRIAKYLPLNIISGLQALKDSLNWEIPAVGIYKIELFEKNNIKFREDLLNGDELTVRELFYAAKRITFTSKKLYYRIHSNAVTKTINSKLFTQLLSFKKLKDIFEEKKVYIEIKDQWESISFGAYTAFLKIYLKNKEKFTDKEKNKIENNLQYCLDNIDLEYLIKYEKKIIKKIAIIICFYNKKLYKKIVRLF
ncbi:glycosyltransferase [Cetobacterium somerae]|uniref:glycosyltransferase n=1 Tax=Cetobacterium somerae TaxID=188913 RepID=UPI003891F81D